MIRRILAGAAIAAAAFGFSASAASADVGLNHSLNDAEIEIINILDEVNLSLLNNNQPTVGDHNKETKIENAETRAE
ncbi:hypothetical protein [Nonomuraea candida]|uniref:hypothetical protein n=1 Tax=Nonomuraea candida TaxID=359159 RepID=UPI0005BA503F|nr:hypothetical protein [Nonomuraea candida]